MENSKTKETKKKTTTAKAKTTKAPAKKEAPLKEAKPAKTLEVKEEKPKTSKAKKAKDASIIKPVVDKFADKEVLLRVTHLKQYFKLGSGKLKAVHDISFDVKKGEVFGLVGESGCGKTTTGRSIIKLYDITSGNIHFAGQRISAGTRWNEKEIKFTRIRAKESIKKLKEEMQLKLETFAEAHPGDTALFEEEKRSLEVEYGKKIEEIKDNLDKVVSTQLEIIRSAKHDHKYCDKDYAAKQVLKIRNEYAAKIADVTARLDKAKAEAEAARSSIDLVSVAEPINNEDRPQSDEFDQKTDAYDNKMEEVIALDAELQELIKNQKRDIKLAKNEKLVTKIQMIFQDPIASLNPRMTVQDIISEGLVIKGIKDKEFLRKKVADALELVGLVPEHATRYPHEFSGGQRQRIGIARALVMEPEMIIADEPISALDVSIKAQVINLLNELREKLGLTILFIAHDLSVVKYFCDRIAVMYFGQIVELTTSDELFLHPLHPYTKSLLSAIPYPDPHYEKSRVRITYNPVVDHDYSEQQPTLRQVIPGHYVMCNDAEEKKYIDEMIEIDSKALEEEEALN